MPRANPLVVYSTGVYRWRNCINGKVYIGSTARSFVLREREHRRKLVRGEHRSPHLQSAWNKHGELAFVFEIVERLPPSKDKCLERETYWIEKTKSADREFGYNSKKIANSNAGIEFSDRAKENFSKGAKRRLERPGERERLAEIAKIPGSTSEGRKKCGNAFRGKHHTDEAKERIGAASRGNTYSVGRVPPNKGKKMGEEQRRALSISQLGKTLSGETKEKISASHLKRLANDADERERISTLTLVRWAKPEAKEEASKAQLERWRKHKERQEEIQKLLIPPPRRRFS